MSLYETVKNMDTQRKTELFRTLEKTASREEALAALSAAGLEADDADLTECLTLQRAGEELSDDELESVAGGAFYPYVKSYGSDPVTFVANVGDIREVASGWGFSSTVRCRIVAVRVNEVTEQYSTCSQSAVSYTRVFRRDEYFCRALEDTWYFDDNEWHVRSDIELP